MKPQKAWACSPATACAPSPAPSTSSTLRQHPGRSLINIQIRIAPGRPEELRQRIVDTLFATAEQTLAELIEKRPIGLQLEITELDRSLTRMAGSLPTA